MSSGGTYAAQYNASKSHEQALLRLSIFEKWKGKCSWCSRAIPDATYAQIDHILPRDKYADLIDYLNQQAAKTYKKKVLKKLSALPPSADNLMNLAPICGTGRSCNSEKSDSIADRDFGPILKALKKAMRKAASVDKRYLAMLNAQGLEGHLVGLMILPDTDEATRVVGTYGPDVLRNLWRAEPKIFKVMDAPDAIPLEMIDRGMVPDYFDSVFRTIDGVDGAIKLTDEERIALAGARALFGLDSFNLLGAAISKAVFSINEEMKEELGDVPYPDFIGSQIVSITGHRVNFESRPEFQVDVELSVEIGGHAANGTDNDGNPRYEDRMVKEDCLISFHINLVDGQVHYVRDQSMALYGMVHDE